MSGESPEARERRLSKAREWKQLNPEAHAKSVSAYRRKYPEKYKARAAVAYALKNGQLQKSPCVTCNTQLGVCAHHEDYSKPLQVIWLCRGCHTKEHQPTLWQSRKAGNPSLSSLTEHEVVRIRKLLCTGLLNNRQIAKIFGVTPENISCIRTGKTWTHIKDGLSIPTAKKGAPSILEEVKQRIISLSKKGHIQASISKELGVSCATVSRILHGRK